MGLGSAASVTIDQLFEIATERHRAGNLADARLLYDRVLQGRPAHAPALFRRGLLELQDGRPEQALALIERVVAIAPCEPRHHLGLGQVLQVLNRHEEAAAAYRHVLRTDPESADAHFALGIALQSLSDHDGAIHAYQAALKFQPVFWEALNNLGNSHQLCGRPAEAAAAYEEALALRPDHAGAMANLGIVLQEMGRIEEAVQMLRDAVDLQPLIASHSVNLGIALCRRRDFAAAEGVFRRTLESQPDNPEALFNLGNALHGLGRPRDAADRYRQAAALRPDYAEALNNLGNVHKELGEFTLAETAYGAAIRARPQYAAALNNAGCLLRTLGRLEEAEDMLRDALQVHPLHSAIHDNLGSVLKDSGELDEAIDCFRKALELDPGNARTHSNLVYALSFQSLQAKPILEESLRWNDRFAAGLERISHRGANDASPGRRLRVGYVSPDFRDHCQTLFTIPVLSRHDHRQFEIFCYSSAPHPDEYNRRIAGYADGWRDVRPLSDGELARLIKADRIDILVDLTMHMANGRPLLFARKPAPIQIAWLAYPGTTGIGAMDFRLSDPRLDPDGREADYSERTIRLPDSFWCYDPLTDQPAVNALPAIERGYVTFGCLNNPCKITAAALQLWAGVMREMPNSHLRLLAQPGRHRQRLLQRLASHGIEAPRISFVPHQNRADYLNSYHDIDLGVDTFPYNGHTTSLDSLWMGVPTVTRVGQTCAGRAGLSQLFQLGLLELAADSDSGFIAAAVGLAGDLPRLAEHRRQLRGRLERSALMDGARFAQNLEAVYRRAWQAFCASSGGSSTM
jgi:protein O-GlcNAc transferase